MALSIKEGPKEGGNYNLKLPSTWRLVEERSRWSDLRNCLPRSVAQAFAAGL